MAEMIPFPLARRVGLIRTQAGYALSMKPASGERQVRRIVEQQRESLLAKGCPPAVVDTECRQLEGAIRAAMWGRTFDQGGAA